MVTQLYSKNMLLLTQTGSQTAHPCKNSINKVPEGRQPQFKTSTILTLT